MISYEGGGLIGSARLSAMTSSGFLHRLSKESPSKFPRLWGNDLCVGADSALVAEASSYTHYLQSVDDQTNFSKHLQDPYKYQTISFSADGKCVSQVAVDDSLGQYCVAAPSKRVRRDESSSEEPKNVSVNCLLR